MIIKVAKWTNLIMDVMELIRTLLLLVSVNLLYRLDCSKVVAFPMLVLTIPVGGESNFGLSV